MKRTATVLPLFLLAAALAARGEDYAFPAVEASGWTAAPAVRVDVRETLGGRLVHGVEMRGEPDGSTNRLWDTTALADGWHEMPAENGALIASVLTVNEPLIAIEGGRLAADAVWTSNATHVVRHWVVVPSGRTLVITTNSVTKLCPGAGIKVEDGGTLRFAGAEDAEAVVTTWDDDTVGAVVGGSGAELPSLAGPIGGVVKQSASATVSDDTHVRFTFSSGLFPTVSVQDASAKRSDGIARIPVLVSGTARDAAFRVDWRAVDGSAKFGEDYLLASGTLRWNKSSDGTKHVEIPLDPETLRGSNTAFRVELTLHYACNVSRASAEVVVREFDFPEIAGSGWSGSAAIRFDGRKGIAGAVAHGLERLGEPDGSTNRLWDTTQWADGWQEIVPCTGSETNRLLAVNSPTIAVQGGRLQSNASWTSAQTHLVRHTVVVPSGCTLTVGEDAVVKFLPGTFIKVEDGGKLSVVGAKGHDAIFTAVNDDTAGAVIDCGAYTGQSMAFDGIRLQSSAATFQDNAYIQTRGFTWGAYPYVKFDDTVAFRAGGMAYVPVSIASGTRNQAFSIDWEAVDGTARFGEDYTLASGTIEWTGTSQGTKTLQIPIVADHVVGETTSFKLRIKVCRGCNPSGPGECTVTIRELDKIAFATATATSAPVRFDGRESLGGRIVHGVETRGEPDGSAATAWNTGALADGWHEIVAGGETAELLSVNVPEIAVEGGRLVADATWDDSTTHLVRHWVVVPSGRTLTVTEGTVVKICPDAGIKVEDGGKLVVNGRDGADAIFTRVNDPAESEQSGGEEEAGGDPSAALLAHYAFTRANLLEAKVGANARESSGRGTVSYSETARNIVRVEDGDILGGRPGAVSVPAGTGFSVPVPVDADGANWALAIDFYLPGQAGGWKTFFSLSQANNSDGALFVRQDGQVGQGNYQTFSSLFGAWHQLTVSTANGTSRYWIDGVQGSLSKNWTLTPGGWLHIAFDNDGEDGEMVLGQVRLYGEATPAGLFSGGGVPVVLAPDPDDGTPVVAIAALKSSVSGGTRLAVRLSDAGGTSCVLRALVSGSDGTSRTVELASASAAGRYEYDLGTLLELLPGEVYSVVVEAKNVSAGKTARTSPRSVLVPVPSAGIDWTELDGGTPGGIVILTGGTFQDNGWYQLRGVTCNASNIGAIEIHDAEVSRKTGMAYVGVTVSGNTRNQSFTADWEAVPGTATFGNDFKLASGRLTWSKSSEGTKWIQIPINKKTEAGARRTFRVRLKTVRGMTGSGAEATVEVREYDEGSLDADEVAFFPEGEGSNEFSVDEPVWKEPIFRHETEPIRLSGAWQGLADPAETTVRLSWEGENGSGVLAEVPGGEPSTYEWRAEDWEVGSYVLRHDVLDASGKRLSTYEKTFAVPSWDGVELHGGTLTSNETWRAGIVHVVYETVYVPALYTILLEPGAIVKFLTGTGITIEAGGGALFANGVVFTHINDDTVGGDTLNDGNTLVPVEDAYEFKGELTIGDESELRYKTQAPLSGTISGSRKLTRGSTYRVSGNVTIASGATLVIPAGTILKFDAGVQMTVNSGGTLLSEGTRAAPVVFTSVKDDEFGGDTNGDGDATIPAPGDWTAVKVAGGRAEFHNTKILYSSRNQTTGAINQNGGTVVFDGGEIAHGLYDAVGVESGNFFMTNAVIRDCLLAFRHWARDPIVNCVIHDCGRLTQGGGQTFVNCVFADIDETWEAFGFPKSTYRNCVFWNEGGSVLTGEGTQDAMTVCGQDGNRWGDPMFRDGDAGDYRIREGSACIDAADSSAAPEKDTFGQKRWDFPAIANADAGAADVGVAECVPRNAASDVDLVPVSAKMSWNRVAVKPGDAPYFFWTVANDGGEDVETDWWDELALVSVSSGRIAVLGEYNQTKGVSAGGTTTGSKYFEIPPLAEGDYRLRLNANSHRSDVPEGSRTENNVLLSDTVVHVEVATEDASVGAAGMAGKGGRIVRKFEVAAGSGAMLAHVTAPAGSVLRYGLGFMPGEGSASGELELDASGRAAFAVPEGADCVYVVLESAADGPFDIVFTDGSLAVASVQPAQVPRSGRVTLRIAGAGFADGCAVSLLSPSGAAVAPERVVRTDAEELWATVDCAALAAAGTRFSVRAETLDGGEAVLEDAIAVSGEEGGGHIWARLDVSSKGRRGSIFEGRIVYGNDGNADAFCPVFKLSSPEGCVRFGEGGKEDDLSTELYLVGLGDNNPRGILRPGETTRLSFRYCVDSEYLISLSMLDAGSDWLRQSVFKTWQEVQVAVSEAATRLNFGPVEVRDFETIYENAIRSGYGKNCTAVSGRLLDYNTGLGMSGIALTLCETNGIALASCTTDAKGGFLFGDLALQNAWTLATESCQLESGVTLAVGNGNIVYGAPFGSLSCRVVPPSGVSMDGVELRVYVANDGGSVLEAERTDGGRYSVDGLSDGNWTWRVDTDEFLCATNAPVSTVEAGLCGTGMAELNLVRSGHATVTVFGAGGSVPAGAAIRLVDSEGEWFESVADANGTARFNAPPGAYSVAAGGGWVVEDEVSVELSKGATVEAVAVLLEVPFGAFPCVGVLPLQTRLFASVDPRFREGCTYAWDFDGDGTVDSREASPMVTYDAAGTYAVSLTVRNLDGTEYSFRNPRAIEVWEPVASEYADGTLVLGEDSGYEIVSADDSGVTLRTTGEAIAAALYEGLVLILPEDSLQAREVVSVAVQDDGSILVETEEVPLTSAYRTVRTAVLAKVARASVDGSGLVCPVERIPIPFSGATFGKCIDLASDLWLVCAIDKVDGKINSYYQGVQGTLTVTFNPDSILDVAKGEISVGRRFAKKFGDAQMDAVFINKTIPVAGIPVNLRVKGFFEATASIGGVSIPFRFGVSIGKSYHDVNEKLGVLIPEDSCQLLNHPFDEMSWDLNGKLEVWGGMEVTAGVGGSVDFFGREWAARVLEATAKTGPALTLEVHRRTENAPDAYRASFGLKSEFAFAPINVAVGHFFTWAPIKWTPKSHYWDWFGGEVQTPVPLMTGIEHRYSDGSVSVSMQSATTSADWQIGVPSWKMDDGTVYTEQACPTHVFRATEANDTVTHEIVMYDTYRLDKKWWPGIPAVKTCRKKIVVCGAGSDPIPETEIEFFEGEVSQSIDPNEVAGPLGLGDPETERFVKPGEWLDFTIYFENATNATAAARTVKIVEDVDPRLDWDSLTLGEVVFANETDRGLVGLSEGASDYEVPGTNYLVRTTFTVHNGLASWYLRLVDPAGDEDGWPTDEWLANYGGFLPPNDTNHVGEGHVTYRIKVRDDAPKNVRIETSAKITFDSHETIPTDPSWWNTVGHPAVELAFFRNCDDAVLSMPTNGPYACDAPEFGTPVREGWFFLGWADTNGIARNCGADLPYGTDALDLYAQWKEIVEAKFATIAVDGGVLIAGLADGEACPEDLVIPSTLEIGGRRVKVVGVADDAFKGKRAIRTLTVMEGVRTIGARSFMNCTSLESVSLPSSVESIGENAFYGCRLLGSLTIAAETPPALGSGAFRSVAAAGVLRVPEGSETAYAAWIGTNLGSAWTVDGYDPGEPPEPGEPAWTLYADQNRLVYAAGAADVRWTIDVSVATDGGVTLLRASTTDERGAALVLPDPVLDETGAEHRIVAIGADDDITLEGVFEGLDLGSVSIPESVVSIAPCAFANCAELEDIVFAGDAPALRTVGAGAFFGCTSLQRVWMDSLFDLAELGGEDDPLGVFESCWNLSDVVLPCYVDSVGAFAFQDCSRLASVTFDGFDGARIRSIGKRAFYNCDSLADVNWDALVGLEEIGEAAFGGDTAATAPKIVSATFHRDFASLGAGALLNAGSLAEITCFAETPPARGANAFLGVARTGVLRVPAAVAEDYTNQTARAWIGPEEGKLPPWNGTSGWSVEYLDASEELRRREAHLTDEAFAGFLALADLLGFTESELCGVDHPAEALRPDLRIVAFDRDATTFPVSIRFENGIDKTSKTAFTRLRGKSGQNIYALVSDELGGAETPVALQGTLDSDGTFRVYLGTAFDKTAPSQFVRIVILDE